MAIANMANHESDIRAAFKFIQIFSKIGNIGWRKLIIWYLITGIVFLILTGIWIVIFTFIITLIWSIVGTTTRHIMEDVLISLIVIPYITMYFYRSVALIYKPNDEMQSKN